ncbi:MAG: hypothetical protein AAB456_03370 [Patescibacteria group bacterium]
MNFTSTLQDYLYEVKRKLRIPVGENNTEWSDTLLIDIINDARLWFWNKSGYVMRDAEVNKNSTANTEEYDLSSLNIKRIKMIRYNNGTSKRPLDYYALSDYLILTETSESGDPFAWTVKKATLKLYPKPSTAVTNGIEIFCEKTLSRLSDSDSDGSYSDETDSDIEADYRHIIVRYAVGLSWADAEQQAKADASFRMAEALYDNSAYEINSETLGQNIPRTQYVYIDETDERRYGVLA